VNREKIERIIFNRWIGAIVLWVAFFGICIAIVKFMTEYLYKNISFVISNISAMELFVAAVMASAALAIYSFARSSKYKKDQPTLLKLLEELNDRTYDLKEKSDSIEKRISDLEEIESKRFKLK